MERKVRLIGFLSVALVFALASAASAGQKGVARISKEKLKGMLDNPDLVIIDVRVGRDLQASNLKIKGALRMDPEKSAEWTSELDKRKTYVLYCA